MNFDIRKKFKKMFREEFDDPNEAFQEFLFSLIPKDKLNDILKKGKKYYYNILNKYL